MAVKNGSFIATRTFNDTSAGNIEIFSSESIIVNGFPSPFTSNGTGIISLVSDANGNANGAAGHINLTTNQLLIQNSGFIGNNTFSNGNSGNILIDAKDINISGQIAGFSPALIGAGVLFSTSSGNAGNIEINTERLTVSNSGVIAASNLGTGDTGKIKITSTQFIKLEEETFSESSRAGIRSLAIKLEIPGSPQESNLSPTANTNNITINTPNLIINGAEISNRSQGTGNAGTLNLNVDRLSLTNNAEITAESASGLGGQINIRGYSNRDRAHTISLDNGSAIATNNATIRDRTRGTIDIRTRELFLNNGSAITATVDDSNAAIANPENIVGGTININATGLVNVDRTSEITASVQNRPGGSIDGGNVTIEAGRVRLANGSTNPEDSAISASVDERGNGGRIRITSPRGTVVALDRSNIRANAQRGRGGDIFIKAIGVFTTPDVKIEAVSELGIDGNVTIQVEPYSRNLITFERKKYEEVKKDITNFCINRKGAKKRDGTRVTFGVQEKFPLRDFLSGGVWNLNIFMLKVPENPERTWDDVISSNAVIKTDDGNYFGLVCASRAIEEQTERSQQHPSN